MSVPRARRAADLHGKFTISETSEPHAIRQKQILAEFPQIRNLINTTEPLTFWISLGILVLQVCMAYWMRDAEWYILLPCAYVIGGTANHSLQLAVHELSHNLCWVGDSANRLTAIMANLATCFPSGQTFKAYHMDHHAYQGYDGIDTDIPHAIEVNYVTNTLSKILWILAQPLCYALRPMLIKPKPFGFWEGLNWAAQMTFNVGILYFFGVRSFTYLLAGTLLGLGLHPSAGHFIAEHYEFVAGTETYSYYGPANFFNFNVGYHNEHHDFPKIPWTKLPLVRKIADKYYKDLPSYTSYVTEVFWPYITDPTMGVFCRVKRQMAADKFERLQKTTDKRRFAPFKVIAFTGMIASVLFLVWSVAFGSQKAAIAVGK